MHFLDFSVRIFVAVCLGAAIGMERQWRQRLAGLRTNALVSMGAAAFVTLSEMIAEDQSPTRIASQVVSGVGFLGGGVILRDGLTVRGLTTAATLRCSAAVGTLAGSGFLVAAVISSTVVVGANILLRPLGAVITRRALESADGEVSYRLQAICPVEQEHKIRTLLLQAILQRHLVLRAVRREEREPDQTLVEADVTATGYRDKLIEEIVGRLSLEPGLAAMSWHRIGRNDQEEPS